MTILKLDFTSTTKINAMVYALVASAVTLGAAGLWATHAAQQRHRDAAQGHARAATELSAAVTADLAPLAGNGTGSAARDAALREQAARRLQAFAQAATDSAAETSQGQSGFLLKAAAALALLALLWTCIGMRLRMAVREVVRAPIRASARLVGQVAEGDLTARLAEVQGVTSTGETRKLLDGLERMVSDLRSLVGAVTRSARTVADASAEMASHNLALSERTEQQASTLEETASSMEELTSTVSQNADNARRASEAAASARDLASRGGQAVAATVKTMRDISQSSHRIGQIISVIDGIAFQTNILALNAAVEAARAGEQGRGFAVVAAEVRNLAQGSANAAKEIRGLIGESVTQVDAGAELVDKAGRTMQDVVAAVAQVSELIAEIAAASQEQSSGLQQVNTAVMQMEHAVQQNASMVDRATVTAASMKDHAQSLLELVERFRLGEAAGAGAPDRRAQPAGGSGPAAWSGSILPYQAA